MTKSMLYTGGGDMGETSLVGGSRVPKNCVRIEAYGTIDELSVAIGSLLAVTGLSDCDRMVLTGIQNELFNIGGYLATPAQELIPCRQLTDEKLHNLELAIDRVDGETPSIRCFVLPSGCEGACRAHTARVICRRAERRVLDLASEAPVDPNVLKYLNRLSDYLFAMARMLNHQSGIGDIPWQQQ